MAETPSLAARLLDLACAIQQIAAPTFEERRRAEFVRQEFIAHGLHDVALDDLGNVCARRPGAGSARPLLITAHLDTVFPNTTNLTLARTAETIHGPGIGDNSLGVAALFGLLWLLEDAPLPGDLWLAANVGEEGLGDLRGMRRVMDTFESSVQATLVLEGMGVGRIIHAGIGVRRYRIAAHAEGGHSWSDFGQASAIHALLRLGAKITELPVPAAPKTTFNIGTVAGGTSINTIAREASLDLDLRSEDPAALEQLAARVEALVREHSQPEAVITAQVIGQRPAGSLPREHPLVQLAAQALAVEGISVEFSAGSTDANVPLSRGLPCVCLGIGRGGNAHRPDEYIETREVEKGLRALAQTVRGAFGVAA